MMDDVFVQNMVAKRIRLRYEQYDNSKIDFTTYDNQIKVTRILIRRELERLALDFANWFKYNTDGSFDPVAFLNKCSPDPERFPLGELWHD